jgi:hypothetical protein
MSKMKIIVGFPWVEECFRVGKLVSIENFIPLYTTGEPGTLLSLQVTSRLFSIFLFPNFRP